MLAHSAIPSGRYIRDECNLFQGGSRVPSDTSILTSVKFDFSVLWVFGCDLARAEAFE